MRDKEFPDGRIICLLIDPGGDDLADGSPPVFWSGLQHPVVVISRQNGGEESLVLSSNPLSIRAQSKRFVHCDFIPLCPELKQL